MKKIYRPALLGLLFSLALSVPGFAQDEVPAPPPPPAPAGAAADVVPPVSETPSAIAPVPPVPAIVEDGDGVIVRHTGKKNAKITLELIGGDVKVNGKPISEFSDRNVSVSRWQPGDLTITTDDDANASVFRAKKMSELKLNKLQLQLDHQQRDVDVQVERALQAQKINLDMQNQKLSKMLANSAYLGVGSKKSEADGALVIDITSASPAEKAGLKKGDIITRVDNKEVHNPDDLFNLIHEYKPGDKVKITLKRDGKDLTVSAVLEKSKGGQVFNYNYHFRAPEMREFRGWNRDDFDEDQPKIGLKAQDNEDGKGVDVLDVVAGSAAEKAGLKKGDHIVRFDGEEINSAGELADRVRETRSKSKVSLNILRDGKPQDLELHIPRKLKTEEL